MEIKAEPGESIYQAAIRTIQYVSNSYSDYFTLVFNDTKIRVYSGSNEHDIAEKYYLLRQIEQLKRERERGII